MCSICSYIIYSYSIVICSDEASSFLSWQPSSIQSTQGFSGNTHLKKGGVLKPPDIYKIAKTGFCVTSLYFPNCPKKDFQTREIHRCPNQSLMRVWKNYAKQYVSLWTHSVSRYACSICRICCIYQDIESIKFDGA